MSSNRLQLYRVLSSPRNSQVAVSLQLLIATLCRRAGIGAAEQRLMFGSKQLAGDVTLAEAGVSDDSALYVLLRLLGGAKKRKKKVYTKPKKQKHKHKKVKLAVLKFYKVIFSPASTARL